MGESSTLYPHQCTKTTFFVLSISCFIQRFWSFFYCTLIKLHQLSNWRKVHLNWYGRMNFLATNWTWKNGCIEGKKFPTSEGKQLRDFCFISDFVRSIFSSIDNTEAFGEVINIASGEPISIKDVVTKIQNIVTTGSPQFGKAAYRVGENMELYADITKAKKLLNWQPKISLEEGLKKTIDVIRDISDAR